MFALCFFWCMIGMSAALLIVIWGIDEAMRGEKPLDGWGNVKKVLSWIWKDKNIFGKFVSLIFSLIMLPTWITLIFGFAVKYIFVGVWFVLKNIWKLGKKNDTGEKDEGNNEN